MAPTIRKPTLTEVSAMKRLIDAAAAAGTMLPRPIMELYESVRDFFVAVDAQGVGGCAALHIDGEDLAEVRSLVVRDELRGQGVGRGLLGACIDDARGLGIGRVYALTRAPEFFAKHGFGEVDKHTLPHKVFSDCTRCHLFPDCDEVAVVIDLDGPKT